MRKGRGEITRISDLFEKYRNSLRAPQSSVVKEFVVIADEVAGITVAPEQVSYSTSTRTLTLKTKKLITNEILLQKDEILAHLAGRLGVQNAPKHIR